MAEHPDVERLRRALSLRGNSMLGPESIAQLEELLADDVVWHGAANEAGAASGKAEVASLWNEFAGNPDVDGVAVGDVYADGEHAAALLEVSVGGAGTVRQATIFHMSGGKIEALWGLPTDRAIADAAASGTSVTPHPNVATFLAAEEARQRSEFGPEDTATISRFLADGVVWHMGGQSEFAKAPPTNTVAEVVEKFKMFKQATGGT